MLGLFDDERNLQEILTERFINSEVLALIFRFVDAPLIIAVSILLAQILEHQSSIIRLFPFPFLQEKRS